MGYARQPARPKLTDSRHQNFRLVIPSTTNLIFAGWSGAEERAQELGYDLFCAIRKTNRSARLCLRWLLARRADGIFYLPVYRMENDAHLSRT